MCAKIIEMTSLLEKRTRGGGAKKPAAESRSRWLFKAIFNLPFRGPQRTSSARVTVVVLCVCVCVCVCLSTTILALQATWRLMSDTNGSYVG